MMAFARHEWRVLARSRVTLAVLAVFVAALAISGWLGATRAAREQHTLERFEQRVAEQRARPVSLRAEAVANEKGGLALLPPAPLGALAVGQSDVYPGYLTVTARRLDALVSGDQVEHPLAVASGPFDIAFVVLFLYPLLIFATSFDLTAGERERGTLRMVLSHPVRLADVVAGKLLARALVLAGPVVILPAAVAAVTPVPAAPAALGLSLVIWTLAVLAYGAIWHGLALVVNARGWRAATNALVLAGTWLLFAVVGPATINLGIAAVYPMPSRVAAAVEARAATEAASVQGSQALGQFLQDHPTSANIGQDGMRQFAALQAARDRQMAERLAAVTASFEAQLQRQQQLASWLSVLSPAMVAQGVLLDAAGTSTTRFEHFRAAAAVFQREWAAYFEPRVLDAATLTPADVAAAPAFRYAEAPVSAMARRAAAPLAAMALAGAALLWLGFRLYRGYAL
jgi:ABC-2 type transport system permease protein